MRAQLFVSIALAIALVLVAQSASSQDDPPETPDINQSLPPDPGDVGDATALDSAMSCTYPDSIDPSTIAATSSTMTTVPTGPSDAQTPSTAASLAPVQNVSADPVGSDGEFSISKTHLSFPGNGVNYEFTLNYRSRISHQSPVGFGWSHNYDRHIEELTPTGTPDCEGDVFYVSDQMERITFKPNGTTADPSVTVYKPTTDAPLILEKHPNDASYYILKDGSGLTYHFRSSRQPGTYLLYKVQDTTGNYIFIYWDDTIKNGDGGIVTKVVDTVGRTFYYNYDDQLGQLISDKVSVNAGQDCPPQPAGGLPNYACIAAEQHAARMGKIAILKCISTKAGDCKSPLVSFQHTKPDQNSEFDLTSVLDADGNGPTFSYYDQPETASYVPDDQLVSACHTICDTKATAADWSCHNLDRCGPPGIQDTVSRLCAGVDDLLNVQYSPNQTWGCDTYAMHACGDSPPGNCYSQNWYTDDYGHWYGTSVLCPYDDHSLNTSKSLPEPLRNAACDGWLASWLSTCNSPLPDVQAFLSGPDYFWPYIVNGQQPSFRDIDCTQGVLGEANGQISNSQICNQYQSDCTAEMLLKVTDAFQSCPTDCFQACRAESGAKDARGNRRYAFGRPQDLNHNLMSIYDGDGRLVVKNVYGLDPFQSSFDRIVWTQQTDSIADNAISYDYHDLPGEQAMSGLGYGDYLAGLGLSKEELFAQIICMATTGCIPFYSATPNPQHVVPIAQFNSVNVCPSTCAMWGPKTPPLQFVAQGMIPWNAIDPSRTGYFYGGNPIVLQSDGGGLFSFANTSSAQTFRPGQVVFQTTLPQGTVTLTSVDGASRLSVSGNQGAIGALFLQPDTLVLQPDSNGHLKLATAGKSSIPPPSALEGGSLWPPQIRLLPPRVVGISSAPIAATPASPKNPLSAVTQSPRQAANPSGIAIPPARDDVAMRIASLAFAHSPAPGRWPIVIRRSGLSATIGDIFPAGVTVATVMTASGESVSIVATQDPTKFSLSGATAGLANTKGQIAIVSPTVDQAYALPANLVTGDGKQPAIRMTGAQGVAAGLLTEGMVCRDWTIGLAATNAGQAIDPQVPETAVVVHDLHGVVRTNYYDDQWLLLRSVNSNNGEMTNYNYANGTLSGVQYPSGERICQQSDGFGKPLQVTKLPAPNLPGSAQRQLTEYSYSPSERLIDTWKDRGLASEAHAHLQRDQWDRITWLDTEINASTTERTTFAYPPAPNSNPQAAFPNQITRFDGDQITLYSDPSGGGPDSIVQAVTGDTPRSTYATYDSYGRVTETGRVKHGGTVIKTTYDPAGLRTQSQTADLLHPGSFLSATFDYNSSRQISHTGDPLLDLYFQHDPYDHVTVEVDVPKDGDTASKSTCNHYSVDGWLEYTIGPEGIVTLNTYDDSGRLVQVDRGYPSKLSDWTTACLSGARAPGSSALPTVTVPPSGLMLAYQTPPGSIRDLVAASQLVGRGFALPQPATPLRAFVENFVSNILNGIGNLGHHLPGTASAPSPSWPSSMPPNDPGMQTLRILKYAPGGFPISDTDGSGVGSYFVTDGFGRVIDQVNGDPAKVDPTQVVHRWRGYDTQDRVTWEAVVSGPNLPAYAKPQSVFPGLASMAEYSYDAKGRRIETDTWFFANGSPVGPNLKTVTKVTFDDNNRRVTTQIDQHPPLIQQSDELGRVTSETLPNGIIKTTLYSEAVNGDTQTRTQPGPDGTPIVLTDSYNDQGLLLSTFQGQDERLHQEYDSYGRTTLKRVANSVTTTFGYDAYSRLVSSSQAAAPSPDRENDFGYDGDDRKVTFSTVNATGTATTQAVYDGLDRLMSSQDPLKRTTTHDYYPNSFRSFHTTDPQGTLYTLNYDFAGRLTSQIAAPGKVNGLDPKTITRSFSYSPLGEMATAAVATIPPDAASGLQVTLAYDSMGNRILESTNGFLPVDIQSTFDSFGKPLATNLVSRNGNTAAMVGRTFDELHRLVTASLNQNALATLSYAGLGGPTIINYGARAADPKNPGGVTTTIQYDFRGRATATDVVNAGGIVASEHQMLGIDGIPRARSHRFGANGSAIYDAFEVDNAARLIKEATAVNGGALPARELANADVDPLMTSGQGYLFYTLDGVANWTNVAAQNGATVVQVDPADEYTAFGSQAIVNTASGQAVAFGTNSYTFDALGQLASATSNGNTIHFSYDALGRRVVETTSQPNQPNTTAFVLWDGSDILATGSSQSDASGYRLGIGGNGLNSHLVLTDSLGSGAVYYVHQGPDNSVIALSNDSGLVEGYRYSAFGTTQFIASDGTLEKDGSGQPLTASSVSNRLLYQGQLQDPSIAGYAMRAREYMPQIGRFLSPDPAGQAGGDNRFVFVSGMPLTMTDPFGTTAQAAVDNSMSSNPDFNESNMPPPAPTCANCASSADQDVFVITHHNSTGITDFDVVPMGQIAPPQELTNDAGLTESEIQRTIAQTNSDLQGAAYFVDKVMPAVIQVELAILPIVGEVSALMPQVGVDVAAPEGAVEVLSNEAQGLLAPAGTVEGEMNLEEAARQIHSGLSEGEAGYHTVAVGRFANGDMVSTISGGAFHTDAIAVSESFGIQPWVPTTYVENLGIHAEDQLLSLSTADNPLVEIGVNRPYCPMCMDRLADAGFEPDGGLTLILSSLLGP